MPPSKPATTPRPLEACGYTHPGGHREDNEDAFGVFLDQRLFVVADGMGGRASGDVASRLAVDELEDFLCNHRKMPSGTWPLPPQRSIPLNANLLRVGLKVVNEKMRAAARTDPALHRMGATIAALVVGDAQITVGHVGDARVYRLRKGALSRLTRDHSVLEEMRAAKAALTPEAITAMAPSNVVTRALGSKDDLEPTVYVNSYGPGDLYLLCSDGLWGCVDDARITAIMTGCADLEQACQSLLDAANAAGGPDNVTAVLVRVR